MGTIVKREDSQSRVTFQGKVRRVGHPTLTKTFPNRELAEAWVTERELDFYKGQTVVSERGSTATLGEIVERYLKEVTPRKKGAHAEAMHMRAITSSRLTGFALVNLRPEHVRAWRDERLRRVSPSTVNRQMNLLHHVIEHARKEWGISGGLNPVSDVSRPAQPEARDRRLSQEEFERLMLECDRTRGGYLRDMVELGLETSMRMSEMLGLDWDQVDLEKRTIRLQAGRTKNGHGRAIPLSVRALEILRRRGPSEVYRIGPMFPGTTQEACTRAFQRAAERAELENLHFHDLRHEAVSTLFEKGLNVMEVASISGHKDVRMLQRYTHLDASKLADKLG